MKNKNQLWIKVSRKNYLKFYLGIIDGVLIGIKRTRKMINNTFLLKIIKDQEQAWIDYRVKIVDKIEHEEIKEKGGN